MSWTGHMWITMKDFIAIKEKLAALEEHHIDGYEFYIGNTLGVVLYSKEDITHHYKGIHDVLKKAGVVHWVIDGEGPECKLCRTVGEDIDWDAIRGGWDDYKRRIR